MSTADNYKGVWDGRIGFGKRPALLVIDFVKGYTTPGAPLYAEGVVGAVARTPPLIDLARRAGIPLIFTDVKYTKPAFLDGGMWIKKAKVLEALAADSPHAQFCDEIAPKPGDQIITKQYASAFFGTSLVSMLVAAGVDTILLTGCTTSGCIRATSIDGVQHGFRTIVVRECVGDRHDGPHEANLFDINAKYGDVVSFDEAATYLRGIA